MQASLNTLHRWIFGNVTFSAREEYEAFRYKFLLVLMLTGAGFTALFVVGEYSKLNRIQDAHFVAMHLFTAAALLLWWLLRGHPGRFLMLAWIYESICLLEYTSSLWFVPTDELRLMWFYVNVPGVFMLLGPRAGWGIVSLSAAIFLGSNAYMPVPYSQNAMATGEVALVYLGVFFHAFCARSMSYFTRMRDYYNQQLEALASHDTLTGVLNARAYYQECERQVALARRMQQPYAVLFVDLDHFKRVNDERGHAAGDLGAQSRDAVHERLHPSHRCAGADWWGGVLALLARHAPYRGCTVGGSAAQGRGRHWHPAAQSDCQHWRGGVRPHPAGHACDSAAGGHSHVRRQIAGSQPGFCV